METKETLNNGIEHSDPYVIPRIPNSRVYGKAEFENFGREFGTEFL